MFVKLKRKKYIWETENFKGKSNTLNQLIKIRNYKIIVIHQMSFLTPQTLKQKNTESKNITIKQFNVNSKIKKAKFMWMCTHVCMYVCVCMWVHVFVCMCMYVEARG